MRNQSLIILFQITIIADGVLDNILQGKHTRISYEILKHSERKMKP